MSDSEEVKVGSFNKVPKRPVPNGAAAPANEGGNVRYLCKARSNEQTSPGY